MKFKRFLLYKLIPTITLIAFIVLMNTGTVLKRSLGPADHLPCYFPLLQGSIQDGQWSTASGYLSKMQAAWRKVVPRIQFSEERDEINTFQHSLARMKGFVTAQDKAGALAELMELKETWADLGK